MADITIDVSTGLITNVTDVLAPKANPIFTGSVTLGEDTILVFEGATDNSYETTVTLTDPTADRTITLPNATGTVITTGNLTDIGSTYLTPASAASTYLTQTDAGTTYQPLDGDLTAIAAISSTSGLLKKTAANTYTLDTNVYAPLDAPTFTGAVVLPSTTTIGDVSSTELSYVNGVTSGIQTQIDSKENADNLISGSVEITLVSGKGSATISGASAYNVIATPNINYSTATNTYSVGVVTSSSNKVIHLKSSSGSDTDTVTVSYVGHK